METMGCWAMLSSRVGLLVPEGPKNGVPLLALVAADWLAGFELLVVLESELAVLVTEVLEELTVFQGKVAFVMRDCPEPPLVVLVTDMVEVTV